MSTAPVVIDQDSPDFDPTPNLRGNIKPAITRVGEPVVPAAPSAVPVGTVIVPAPEVAPIAPVVAPTPVVVAPIAPVQQRYEYQPTDEHGNRLGGKQVILYTTPDELAEKLTKQNVELVRKLRQVTKENRLGKPAESLPDNLERLSAVRKPLTVDERYAISQDLNSPEEGKFEAARDRLLDSAGYNELQFTVRQLQARTNAAVFIESHPDFYPCEENLETVTDWMIKNGLQPTVRNFEIAQSTMNEAGLLLSSPIVREEVPTPAPTPVPVVPAPVVEQKVPNTQEPAAPVARISDEVKPQQTSQVQVPSGLNSRIASNSGVQLPSETYTMTLADVERMSSDEYKRRLLTDPKFSEMVNKLEATRPPRPRR